MTEPSASWDVAVARSRIASPNSSVDGKPRHVAQRAPRDHQVRGTIRPHQRKEASQEVQLSKRTISMTTTSHEFVSCTRVGTRCPNRSTLDHEQKVTLVEISLTPTVSSGKKQASRCINLHTVDDSALHSHTSSPCLLALRFRLVDTMCLQNPLRPDL